MPQQVNGGVLRRLRVVMIAPPYFSVPPRDYGGIETVVADLIDNLVGRWAPSRSSVLAVTLKYGGAHDDPLHASACRRFWSNPVGHLPATPGA